MRWVFRDKTVWWSWFAWHPVHLENGEWAWLERVERRSMPGIRYSFYVHRALDATLARCAVVVASANPLEVL